MQGFETFPQPEVCEGDTHSIRTLVYHRITDNELLARDNPRCVHESEFRRHLDLLDRWGFTTITFRDCRLFAEGSLHLPRKPVILTIEGAHLDTYRVAFQILQESGGKAVVFSLAAHPGVTTTSAPDHPHASQMSADQLREMSAEGMEIGSLTLTYPDLSTVSAEIARDEIVRSKATLERILECRVLSFAYPYGIVSDRAKAMVADAQYAFACAWSSGPQRFDLDPLEIRRFAVRSGIGSLELEWGLKVPNLARALWRAGS